MQPIIIATKNSAANQQQNLLTTVFQNRRLTALLFLAAVVQTVLVAVGISAWMCPLKNVFSIPCPACGMTTGVVHLLHGQWKSALQAHLFSPLLLAAMAAAGLAVMLPFPIHSRLITRMEILERSSKAGMWILVGLGVFWIWRLAEGI